MKREIGSGKAMAAIVAAALGAIAASAGDGTSVQGRWGIGASDVIDMGHCMATETLEIELTLAPDAEGRLTGGYRESFAREVDVGDCGGPGGYRAVYTVEATPSPPGGGVEVDMRLAECRQRGTAACGAIAERMRKTVVPADDGRAIRLDGLLLQRRN